MRRYAVSLLLAVIGWCPIVRAQDSAAVQVGPLAISGYIEAYYSYDFDQPLSNNKAAFFYNYSRNNEVNVNLGFIKAAYAKDNIRANLALGAGTYINANYTKEPDALKNLYEANAGIKLSKKEDLWLDAGIFSSHIGFESAVGKDAWNLTRSILAENSPYYESGAKLTYTSKNAQWLLSALVLNGWQRITRQAGSTTPSFGTQVQWVGSEKVTLNSSTFIGSDTPDSVRRWRYFHDFFGIFQLSKLFGITAGFDGGLQQAAKGSSMLYGWYSPVLICRLSPLARNNFALRVEYYKDAHGIIVPTGTTNGFALFGWSFNYDYAIRSNALWRIEVRNFAGKDSYFMKHDNALAGTDTFITTSLAISFQ